MIAQTIILSVISSILLSSAVHADDPCRYEVSGKGVIDLTSVGRSDGEPAYKNLAPLVESNYRYSYNPCKPFNEGRGCENVAACQVTEDMGHIASLGSQKSAEWNPGDEPNIHPFISYSEGVRKVIVVIECSTTGEDKFEVIGEIQINVYTFRLVHKCACWNACVSTTTTTLAPTTTPVVTTTSSVAPVSTACRLEYPGKGVIDFSFIGRTDERAAYTDELTRTSSHYTYSYNPCRPFSEGSRCVGVSVCQTSLNGEEMYALGTQESATWNVGSDENSVVSINYSYDAKKVIVQLQCSLEGNNEFQAFGEDPVDTYRFQLKHKCACWNGCSKTNKFMK